MPKIKLGCVYQIFNEINGKRYVGSTTRPNDRFALHRRQLRSGKHHSKHLQRAWDKYGELAFTFKILTRFIDVPLKELLAEEQHWMDAYKVTDPSCGYNSAPLAGSNAGRVMTPEAKKRISDSLKGRKLTAEHRAKIGDAHRGRKHTAQTRTNMSKAAQARGPQKRPPCSLETRRKISASLSGEKHPQFGKPLSKETKRKISEKGKGRPYYGQPHTEETKAKLRVAALGRPISQDARAKIGAANRGRKHTEEAKAKMREAARKRRETKRRG